jgi:hypothetical protein
MFVGMIKRLGNVPPRVPIISALVIIIGAIGMAFLLTRGGSTSVAADSKVQPLAARIDRVDGSLGVARLVGQNQQTDFAEATVNTPVTVGDRIYCRDGAHASVALTGHDFVRLNPATSLDVLALDEGSTQLALRSGSAVFDVGELSGSELFEVATPCGSVDFRDRGLYQVGIDGDNAVISVLSGRAEVVGQEGSGYIDKGQVFTLACGATEAQTSTLAPALAGRIVDEYYRYRYPRRYDGRYLSYEAYLAEPFYYDPYWNSVSYEYLPADIPGLYDLDYYGDWVDTSDYGYCWAPRVSAGWAPFQSGYWDLDDLWGPSWVSYESWGWAPYHYGRWAFLDSRWFWVPTDVRTRAVYSPAAVSFIPLGNQIAWVPLGPGETYVSRYYDANWTPRYLASAQVINSVNMQRTFINLNAPGAVTVVPIGAMNRVIDRRVIAQVDPAVVANSRAVLDPLSIGGVRQFAINHEGARRTMRLARAEQEALDKPVVTGAALAASPLRTDIASALRVEQASGKRKEKLKINETAQATSSSRADNVPQTLVTQQAQERMSELAARAQQGDKSARREMRQMMREEQRSTVLQQQQTQQTQQQQLKQQRRAERQQQSAAAATQAQAQQTQRQQMKQQRRIERQNQAATAAQGQAQQQQTRQQQRLQRQQQAAAQEQARQAQRQQMKQERRVQQEQQRQQQVERKPPKQKPPQAFQQQSQAESARIQRAQQEAARQSQIMQQREQLKAQRHAEQQRQAIVQQESARQAQAVQQQREQIKAQRHAEQQRPAMPKQAARGQAAQPQPRPEKAQRKHP